MKRLLVVASLLVGPALLLAQGTQNQDALGPGHPQWRGQTVPISPLPAGADTGGVDPAAIIKPLTDQWLSYSGDLSGKRYSLLKQVNTSTV